MSINVRCAKQFCGTFYIQEVGFGLIGRIALQHFFDDLIHRCRFLTVFFCFVEAFITEFTAILEIMDKESR